MCYLAAAALTPVALSTKDRKDLSRSDLSPAKGRPLLIAAGATDQAVRDDLVRRFGDYVLFTPPVRTGTWLLWFGPFGLVLLAGTALLLRARRKPAETPGLTPDEERRLDEVLRNEKLRRDPDATSPHDGL